MRWQFEDYTLETGFTDADRLPWASLKEFFALVATGPSHDVAIRRLRGEFEKRVKYLEARGEPVPPPGAPTQLARFASNEQMSSLASEAEEFWRQVFAVPYKTSFVSDESTLASWEHYSVGGRSEIIKRVKEFYGVDVTESYDLPIPQVLRMLKRYRA